MGSVSSYPSPGLKMPLATRADGSRRSSSDRPTMTPDMVSVKLIIVESLAFAPGDRWEIAERCWFLGFRSSAACERTPRRRHRIAVLQPMQSHHFEGPMQPTRL